MRIVLHGDVRHAGGGRTIAPFEPLNPSGNVCASWRSSLLTPIFTDSESEGHRPLRERLSHAVAFQTPYRPARGLPVAAADLLRRGRGRRSGAHTVHAHGPRGRLRREGVAGEPPGLLQGRGERRM